MSHEFISFKADVRHLRYESWIDLGEIKSKCQHLAQVPLQPELANRLMQIYLAKGVHATTAIEGNTLTEDQVLLEVEGKLEVPASREYQRQEVRNILDIFNRFGEELVPGSQYLLTIDDILRIHRDIFQDIEAEDHVAPGNFRSVSVGVADYGAPEPIIVPDMMNRLCEWLNRPEFVSSDEEHAIPMAVIRAVLAHLYIAWIHPFGDGNGRTARALEFLILVGAGIPAPAAHLLSNNYHLTRPRYYRELQYASKTGDPLKFIQYALEGFKDGLREQLRGVYDQLVRISMKDYIYEVFDPSGLDGRLRAGIERRRKILLAFARLDRAATISEVLREDVEAALAYAKVTKATLGKDVEELVSERWLLELADDRYQSNKNLILRFRPRSGLAMMVPELPLE